MDPPSLRDLRLGRWPGAASCRACCRVWAGAVVTLSTWSSSTCSEEQWPFTAARLAREMLIILFRQILVNLCPC